MTHESLDVTLVAEQLWQPVPGGSGTYIRELASALVARGDVALRAVRAAGPQGDGHGLPASVPIDQSRLPRAALYEAWTRWRLPRVPGPRPQVLHATTWAVPPRSAPLVVTVHDLAFRRSPEHFTPRGVAFFERALTATRRDADAVIVPSLATRDDAVAAGVDPSRLHVIAHGVSAAPVDEAAATAFRARHGITRPYVLWCGAIEPRKNLGVLLDAFSRLVEETDLDLVLVGPDGWGGAAQDLRARRAALPADRVHVLGAVSWRELQEAYAAARVFCFPSLWEGFGMPVLEAQAHGVPVVTSRGTSMAEVVGGGAVLIDPLDADDVAAGIQVAVGPAHGDLAAAARANAAAYTWERSAEQHVTAYRAALSHARAS
ncbi:glycosyltransferase family 4 protein [Xylanimonas ulmi]|uniref:Glycosyltransferase involved in cell wall biosynthesis n=1 Tax=Xylanimonas ulmi TaxID=228973 RepID=A0A4Q7M096_9MICO|nr:glycosyltransferase family 1 protein [Xylanibacterium ulmi]RZS59972.1 glycosyltransferase involved in cell wall biosynthesis [Xylanibacterium ulmi]